MSVLISKFRLHSVLRFFFQIACLFLAGYVGFLISYYRGPHENSDMDSLRLDSNSDGKVDATYYYDQGVITHAEQDRNFDGKLDSFEWYENGIISRGETDDDFDGKIDGWYTYKNGNLWHSKHDTDKNGVPDVFQQFESGVIKTILWRPNEATNPSRLEIYEMSVKTKELFDTTGDGLLDTITYFDEFENQISQEIMSKPMSAMEATK